MCCSFPWVGLGGKLGACELTGSKLGSLDMERLKTVNFLSLGKLAKTSYSCFVIVFFTSVTNGNTKLFTLHRRASVGFGALNAYAPTWSPQMLLLCLAVSLRELVSHCFSYLIIIFTFISESAISPWWTV